MEQDRARGKPSASHIHPSQRRSPDYSQRPSEAISASQHLSSAQGYSDGSSGLYHGSLDPYVLGRPASVSSYDGSNSLPPLFERQYTSSALPSSSTSSLVPYFSSAVQPSGGESSGGVWRYPYDQMNLHSQAHLFGHTDHDTTYMPNIPLGYSRSSNTNHQVNAGPTDGPTRPTSQPLAPHVSGVASGEQAAIYAGVNPSLTLAGRSRAHTDLVLPSPVSSESTSRSNDYESGGQPRGTRHLACDFCRGRKLKCIMDAPNERCRQCLVSVLAAPSAHSLAGPVTDPILSACHFYSVVDVLIVPPPPPTPREKRSHRQRESARDKRQGKTQWAEVASPT